MENLSLRSAPGRRITLSQCESALADRSSEEDGDSDGDMGEDELRSLTLRMTQEYVDDDDTFLHGADDALLKMLEESEASASIPQPQSNASPAAEVPSVAAAPTPQEESSSSPDHKRPKRVSEQQTLDGFFAPAGSSSRHRQSDQPSDDTCKEVNGLHFFFGDTWAVPKTFGIYIAIQGFLVNGLKQHATCDEHGVTITLAHTFIGKEESDRLCNDPVWSHRQDPGFAVCSNRLKLLPAGAIKLSALRQRLEDIPPGGPKPLLQWDCGVEMSKLKVSTKFNCAYHSKLRGYVNRVPPKGFKKPVVLDLFAGCGGMGQGFSKAGFNVKFMVENNPAAVATLRANHKSDEVVIYGESVTMFLDKVEAGDPAYPKPRGQVGQLHASPPCQGYSHANIYGGKNDLSNNGETFVFLRAVKIFMPLTVSMENVTGMLDDKHRSYPQHVVAELILLGYQVRLMVLDASDYGDPQSRQRVMLFAARIGRKLADKPIPTHRAVVKGQEATAHESTMLPKVSTEDALKDLEEVEPQPGSGMVMVGGKVLLDHNVEGTTVKDMEDIDAKTPANTVRRSNAIRHYSKNRALTVRERARLQSFPDDFVFCGSLAERNSQIGNAVPFKLAHAVATSIMESHTKTCIQQE